MPILTCGVVSNTSSTEPSCQINNKPSAAALEDTLEPTVVHRIQFKSRPSLMSIDRGVLELTPPDGSPSTSAESGSNSGKSSNPNSRPGDSTGKTSLDSKFSASKAKIFSQHSSDNKKVVAKQMVGERELNENAAPLASIEEIVDPEPVPSKAPFPCCSPQC